MKCYTLLWLLFAALLICDTLAEKPRKQKKFRRIIAGKKPVVFNEDPEVTELTHEEEEAIKVMEKDEENEKAAELARENKLARQAAEEATMKQIKNLCSKVHCGAGRVCEVDDNNEAQCVCVSSCPVETEARRKVCTNLNETWTSDCAVYQHHCWCDRGDDRCKNDEYKHVHIEYYGECREMPECSDDEMADFPRRMRDWLFNIMRDLADRQELREHYLKMEREAETNLTRRWTNAAIWKWCDLDGQPHDRSVSRHELFPIRAPLMALEHCIAPFLNGCDVDDNHRISLQEWAKCLELDEEDIDDRCEAIEESETDAI